MHKRERENHCGLLSLYKRYMTLKVVFYMEKGHGQEKRSVSVKKRKKNPIRS